MAICRKTIGYEQHRDTCSDYISLSQLQKITGLARATVVKAIKDLEDKEIITVTREGKINKIKFNIDSSCGIPIQNEIVHNVNQSSIPDEPMVVSTVNTQKKDKETIQNKYYDTNEIKSVYTGWQWNTILQQHSEKSLCRNLKKRHYDIIKDLGIDVCRIAINNYAFIIARPKEFWYTAKFTFWRFLEKIDTFLDSADPLNNYKIKDKQNDKPKRLRTPEEILAGKQ